MSTHLLRAESATRSNKRTPRLRIRVSAVVCARSPNQAAASQGRECRMSKSILLGCTAAFVVVGGAHAADLPVKAKPVEYVKICSAYGAGFFYVPGTDTCIKIGGWVRAEYPTIPAPATSRSIPAPPVVTPASIPTSTTCGLAGPRRSTGAPDRVRNAARVQPRRLPDIDWRNGTRQDLHRARIHPVRGLHLGQVAVLLRLLWRQVLLRLYLPGQLVHDQLERQRCSPPTRQRSATGSRRRSRWKTTSCAAAPSGTPPTTPPTRS